MEREDFAEETALTRCVSNLDCLALSAVLATSLDARERRNLLEPFVREEWEVNLRDDAWVLVSLHRSCHRPNKLSRKISKLLDERFADAIEAAQPMGLAMLSEWAQWACGNEAGFPALLWTLLRDNDDARHQLGQCMLHDWLGRAAARAAPHPENAAVAFPAPHIPARNDAQIARLERRIAEQQDEIDRMLEYIQRTRPTPSSVGVAPEHSSMA